MDTAYSCLCPYAPSQVMSFSAGIACPSWAIVGTLILPLIFEAADNCTPPLFEDQPQEKINIISKLGFGMHDEVSLENEGETKWYTPMSCEKIKMHLPQLCKENKDCAKINNPFCDFFFFQRWRWDLC